MRKTISILLAGLVLTGSASAAVEIDYIRDNADVIKITGDGLSEDSRVTVTVFANDKNSLDIGADFIERADTIYYVNTTVADSLGKWQVEWKPGSGAECDIYVTADGTDIVGGHIDKFVLNNMQAVHNTLKTGTQAEILEVFADDDKYKALIGDDAAGRSLVGKSFYNMKRGLTGNPLDYIMAAKAAAAVSEGKTGAALDILTTELKSAGFDLSDIDKYNQNTEVQFKTKTAERLVGCENYNLTEFDAAFTEAVILSGIETAVNWTDAKEYLDLLGNSTYEANKDAVAKAVVGKSYNMTTLSAAINTAVNTVVSAPLYSGGGGGGGSAPTVIVPPVKPQTEEKEEPKNQVQIFGDVSNDHWAFGSINLLRWKNIICGDEKGNYYPNNKITRAETVKMLCEAFGIEPKISYEKRFEDVSDDQWFAGYVDATAEAELVSGTGEDTFSPFLNITRQDISVMIYRFAQASGMTFDRLKDRNIKDIDTVASYAKDAVEILADAGIISGREDASFEPYGDTTRAEAAVIIAGVLEKGRGVNE